jgi:YD repeat-containing protein
MRRIGGSIRFVCLGILTGIVVLVASLLSQVGASTYGAGYSGGSLVGNPLVVPGAESFLGGQQAAAQLARRANPFAVLARQRSQVAYVGLTRAKVAGLISRSFPDVIGQTAGGAPRLPVGTRLVGYPTTHAEQLALPNHQLGIVESAQPLARRLGHGRLQPIDLALKSSGAGYAPAVPARPVLIPREISSGVEVGDVSLTPVDASGRRPSSRGILGHATVIYPATGPSTDMIAKPTLDGFQLDAALRSFASPDRLYFSVGVPRGARLHQDRRTGTVHVTTGGRPLATVMAPSAEDSAETAVPVSMRLDGHTLVIEVTHRAGSYLYPIDVDPEVNDSQLAKTTGGKPTNWQFSATNLSHFEGKEAYEGAGKEHLETKGIAEYGASERAYWGYETKGNSKIYELKAETAAKNISGGKIESFVELQEPGGAKEEKELLSTEANLEYGRKPLPEPLCPKGKETCVPTAGHEKNSVHFQQSTTGSSGSKYGFSDTLYEGIVSISEPAGTHSTTSYNTTSPELEFTIEGKLVKRKNGLFGSSNWLSNFGGALQLNSADPGIGVATTRLEYESSTGAWTELSRHEYLEKENACQGVQCYGSHNEYWTLDPKLPDGERKIRYGAEEAIAGTKSLATEGQATVKVDAAKPHRLWLNGLPYGEEMSERPYELTGEATDGEGSELASSGIKSLSFYVDGSQFGSSGGSCSVAHGECTASNKWTINGAELGAGHHAIVLVAFDNAGNEARLEKTISIRHSTPVALGPGSVDLQSGDFALGAQDVSMGSGLTVGRTYSSRDLTRGQEGSLGLQWNISVSTTESLREMVDGGMILADSKGGQSIFAPLLEGKFESPFGDSNLALTLEENKATKQKLAYYLTDAAKKTSVKFTQPAPGTAWLPTKQEGAVATDTVTYKYQAAEQYTEYDIGGSSDAEGTVAGPDGDIWTATGYRGVDKMAPNGVYTEYAFPAGSFPVDITVGPDKNLWVTEVMGNKIAKVTTNGTITHYALPAASGPEQIVAGPDGNLWFTEYESNKIGKITTAGAVTEYSLPAGTRPFAIATGPDGNIWFSENETHKIVKMTTAGTIAGEYAMAGGERSYGIVAGPDGKIWYTKYSFAAPKVVRMSTSGTVSGEYALSSGATPRRIIVGPDKNLWVADENNKVDKITTGGVLREFPTAAQHPWSVASGPDGNVWYAEEKNKIGVMPTSGVIVRPLEALAPKPAGVSCEPELHAGCRALKFKYASETTATGEGASGWGQFRSRLSQVLISAYNPVSKVMQETVVAEYSYDKLGRLRAEWDPRISPALKTKYGYDQEGHVTALTPPGQESWTFTYGAVANDKGTGRLLKVSRAPASEGLWEGALPANTEAPAITGSPVAGVRMAVSNGKWSGSPVSYGYQWEDCDTTGAECTPIVGANNQNYTPVSSDVGHKLMAVVAATNGGGSVGAATAPSAKVEVREFTEYSLPSGSHPFGITWGPDNNMWFTNTGTGKVGKITTAGGTVTEYSAEKDEPEGITTGPDGNLWFVEHSIRHVNHMTTSGALTVYTLTRTGTYNVGIVRGSDNNLWFTESESKYVAKINASNEIKGEYLLPASGSKPYGIAVGWPEPNIWVADYGANKIDRITESGTITEFALPAGSKPYDISSGVDGNMWFTENGTNKVGKITPTGTITEYALPAGSAPRGITAYGNLFVAEYGTNKIAQVTTSGAITEYALPSGSQPDDVWGGPDGNLWFTEYGTNKILRFNPNVNEASITEGEAKIPSPGFTMEYGVPLSGSGLPTMTESEVAKWGQGDAPVEATAIVAPDARQGWPATSYSRATISYLDEHGRTVNQSNPSSAPYGSVATTEYNELNDVVRTLSADNRQKALEAGGESVNVAKLLATYFTYKSECSKPSENKEEAESQAEGARLCEVEGPQHTIKYAEGNEHRESLARLHTKYFYDEKAPAGETYNLKTKETTIAELANEEEREVRKTIFSYSGQSNLGWKLREPTSMTIDPEGKKLTTTTFYNSTTGKVTETRAPLGAAGESAHDEKIVYYSAAANTEGYSSCGNRPEWDGLACETLPAKQPEAGTPALPVTVTTAYNIWNEPETVTETFGSTARTKKMTYDSAGRLGTSETTSTADVALPKVTTEYNTTTGKVERQSTTVEAKTKTVTSKYNTLGQMTEYTDADGNTAKYTYGGPENDWLLEELADGSAEGTGRQVYSYNATTKQLETLWDSAAGTFTASYDAEGKMTSEVYPNAMCANTAYNEVGESTHIEYIKTSKCSESGAPVWYSETLGQSVRGATYDRASTLAGESYFYDTAERLTEAQEAPAGEGCSVRLYAYDEESNRTSQTTRVPATGGKCATEGGTVLMHSYDEGNRLKDPGVTYDVFGNVTKLPAADAEGHELTSTFYVDNAVATQSQNGVTHNYYLDPEGRVRETVTGATTVVNHYDGFGGAVTWTSEGTGKGVRNIPGIDGTMSATQANGETPVLQLHDLQGDVVATASLSTEATKVLSSYNSTEFGVPNAEKAPPKFAWLGAMDVASAFSSGVITYGSTSYVPQTGRALQSEQVVPPGLPNGSGAGAPFISPMEAWNDQGANREAAEAPGLEAAREQEAWEVARAAATDPLQVHYMNKTKARALAEKLWDVAKAGEVAEALDIPLDWVEAAVGVAGKIAVGTAIDWLVRTSEMLWKCGNNKWSVVGVKANICKLEYSVLDVAGTDFVDFTKRANVFVCLDNSGKTCFHQVFPDPPKEEVKCAFGIFCIADIF